MTQASIREQYTKMMNVFGIPRDKNPFPFEPPKKVDYWADNKAVLPKIVQIHIDSVTFSSSFVYILFGPIGGGKTFAVKYLANPKTQSLLFESLQKPKFEVFNLSVPAIVPLRAGQLTFSLHKDIVVKCFTTILKDLELARELKKAEDIGEGKVKAAFNNLKKSMMISFDGAVNTKIVENSEGYKFLTQSRSRLGKLQDVNELVETIRVLINILSRKYGRIILSIDELENLSKASGTEKFLCSDFLRKIHDLVERDITLLLIFTFDSFEDVERLLQKAFLSRVKEKIEFPFVEHIADVKEYIIECILQRTKLDPYELIEEEVVDEISETMIRNFQGRLSFRDINREMHKIFASTYSLTDQSEKYKIDLNLYKRTMKGITAEEVVKQLTEKLNK